MSFENKYRVHEVAKDLGKSTKEITQILSTYATTPKNHMQVLDDKELSLIFERVTQNNQVADMQASLGTPARRKRPSRPETTTTVPGTTVRAAGTAATTAIAATAMTTARAAGTATITGTAATATTTARASRISRPSSRPPRPS